MKTMLPLLKWILAVVAIIIFSVDLTIQDTYAAKIEKLSPIEIVKKESESHVRNLLEPVLQKYCRDECKLMGIEVTVDLETPDEISPGFDEFDPKSLASLAPSSARVKLLIDEKVGPNSRTALLDLLQQYIETIGFPVKIDLQLTKFPQPIGSASKINELREKVSKQFKNTIEELFRQFCPNQCLLADFTLQTEVINPEEAQYGASGEFIEDNGVAIKIKNIFGTLLIDSTLTPQEQSNILEMAKLKTNYLKNVSLSAKAMKFPKPTPLTEEGLVASGKINEREFSSKKEASETTDSKLDTKNNSNENSTKQERFERIEKIERIENGDAVQAELQNFKVFGLIFACSILALLVFIAISSFRTKDGGVSTSVHKVIQSLTSDPISTTAPNDLSMTIADKPLTNNERSTLISKLYEIERLYDELMQVFVQQPKVAKHVFSRILTEEGVETTAQYVHLFGESIVIDMLRDPSLQNDLAELMEYYAKNPMELNNNEKLDLLRKLHHRTVAGKLVIVGSRSSNLFDYLTEMDGLQILDLIHNESLTVKAIILTQCDPQKRTAIYAQLDESTRMSLLAELSRIDYLPRDYIFNVANALKRKRRENPKLNTESLPGSEVLLHLLERTGPAMQKTVVQNLELNNPESARLIKSKLVCMETLRHLRDGQLLEVVLSLKHDELLQFLKGTSPEVRSTIFSKAPKDLVAELEDELVYVSILSREAYQAVERKLLNRMKIMANEGLINLVETNDRMLTDNGPKPGYIEASPPTGSTTGAQSNESTASFRKVSGW